ncbi:MAG: hypothetical protein GXP48_05885 [Acidobacteria bacterium]|nr:hypothetical protein [Acidobacteriota bacterium]
MTEKKKPNPRRMRARSKELRQKIAAMDFVASGTLHVRTKVCGKKNCKCATDPTKRHGPYHEWSRRKNGKLLHKILTPEQAQLVERAISNYRQIQKLLAQWEEETASEILNPPRRDDQK